MACTWRNLMKVFFLTLLFMKLTANKKVVLTISNWTLSSLWGQLTLWTFMFYWNQHNLCKWVMASCLSWGYQLNITFYFFYFFLPLNISLWYTCFSSLYLQQLSLNSFGKLNVSTPVFADHSSASVLGVVSHSVRNPDQRGRLHQQTLHVTCLRKSELLKKKKRRNAMI